MTDPREVFAALADRSRHRVLELVAEGGEVSASDLAAELAITRQAILKHLKVLERAGLVTARRAGHRVVYSVTPAPLQQAAGWLTDRANAWDDQLRLLKQTAEANDRDGTIRHDRADR